MIERIRKIVEGGSPQSLGDKALAGALSLTSAAYGAIAGVRSAAYTKKIFSIKRLPVPVLCIGNLTVGGTGKTPVTAAVAEWLLAQGHRPAIISRGYGATARKPDEVAIVSEGNGPIVSNEIAGDEPYLLARLTKGVPIIVCADRHEAGALAIERFGCTMIMMDDGFQHRRLHREIDFVLLDASRDPDSMRLFPRGPLREPFHALSRAALIGLTRMEQSSYANGWWDLANKFAPGIPRVKISFNPTGIFQYKNSEIGRPIESLCNRKIYAFCAIGNPSAFYHNLETLGVDLVGSKTWPDHHRYSDDDLAAIQQEAKSSGAEMIITTDKDATKLNALNGNQLSRGLPIVTYRIQAQFDFNVLNDVITVRCAQSTSTRRGQ